jgi:hypothetical protein
VKAIVLIVVLVTAALTPADVFAGPSPETAKRCMHYSYLVYHNNDRDRYEVAATVNCILGTAWRKTATYLNRPQQNLNSSFLLLHCSSPLAPMKKRAKRDDWTAPQESKLFHLACVGAGASILPPFATHVLK